MDSAEWTAYDLEKAKRLNNDCTFDTYVDGYVHNKKENSIVWHDLRKNPEDEPEENHTVLLLTTNEPVIARYDAQIQAFFRMNEHSKYCVFIAPKTCIAWCEVPVFTKGD